MSNLNKSGKTGRNRLFPDLFPSRRSGNTYLYKFALVLVAIMPILQSCSEDLDVNPGINQIEKGVLQINLAVPDPITVSTRDGVDESKMNVLHVFIFNEGETALYQHVKIDGSAITGNSVAIPLNSSAKDQQSMIYVVANEEGVANFTTVSEIKSFVLNHANPDTHKIDVSAGIPMIGKQKVNTASATIATLNLYRNLAKLTTTVAAEGYELEEYNLYNYASKGYAGAGIAVKDDDYKFNDADKVSAAWTITDTEFLYPTKGISEKGQDDGTYMVIKVKKTSESGSKFQFYRLNLRIGDEIKDGNLEYVNFEPNHWYKVKITDFLNDGYDSYAEAEKHPESDQFVAYEIHDHASEVLSMVTDGMRELGVSSELILNSTQATAKLIVKVYNANNPDSNIPATDIEFSDISNWLSIDTQNVIIHNHDNDFNKEWDKDNGGFQYEFPVRVAENASVYEDQEGYFTVTWKGTSLKRTVKVTFIADFQLPNVCDAKLTIIDNDHTNKGETIDDYWTFILGNGEGLGNGTKMPKLWGIQPDDMTGQKKRQNGFHFPMPYGNKAQWEYQYEVDFSELAKLPITGGGVDAIITNITATISDSWLSANVRWEYPYGNSSTGKLSLISGKNLYNYCGGTITFKVTFGNTDQSDIVASIYHTGFFHRESDSNYVPSDKLGYYYYEVVPMAGGYWLDRNIGATANSSFIDNDQSVSDEQRGSAGMQYSIMKTPKDFQLPDFDIAMCPPGYHIPTQTEWDALRLDNNFKTRSVIYGNTVYMSTYYETGNTKIGNIFLQKARFYNEPNAYDASHTERYNVRANAGDAGAAYYWTVTEAPAMEKEQMGNWVRALYLNGTASSYVNASLTDHRMPIRCKSGNQSAAKDANESYISFNVHDATHAFIFNADGTPLFTFPGKAIGSSDSAKEWQHFYCSTTQNTENLYVLFVRINTNGEVFIIRKAANGDKNDEGVPINFRVEKEYKTEYLSPDYAWKVEKGKYYDFCDAAQVRAEYGNGYYDEKPANPDCDFVEHDNNGSGGGDVEQPKEVDPNDYDFNVENPSIETVLTYTKSYFKDYNNSCRDLADAGKWTDIPVGAILRVYTVKIGKNYDLRITDGWNNSQWNFSNSREHTTDSEVSIIEVEITQEMLTAFMGRGGAVLYGDDFVFLGATIDKSNVKLKTGNVTWSGREDINWNTKFTDLASTAYDWTDVKAGSTLTILWENNNGAQIKVQNGNQGQIPGLPDTYASWNNNLTNPIVIVLTNDMLNHIRNNGGLLIAGGNYFLTGVELKMAN